MELSLFFVNPIFCDDENIYIIDKNGLLLLINENFELVEVDLLNNLKSEFYFNYQDDNILILNNRKMLIANENNVGGEDFYLLDFNGSKLTVFKLDKSFLEKKNRYRILYQNTYLNEVYVVEENLLDNKSYLLIL
ncbi:MAG: hypothetical protein ACK5LT_04410 [Lachnospirales bacterium]